MDQKLKDPVLQKHFDQLFVLFSFPGWQNFIEDVKRYAAGRENPRNITNLDFAKGELATLDWLTGYQEMNEAGYRMMLVDDQAVDALETKLEAVTKSGRAVMVDWLNEGLKDVD